MKCDTETVEQLFTAATPTVLESGPSQVHRRSALAAHESVLCSVNGSEEVIAGVHKVDTVRCDWVME